MFWLEMAALGALSMALAGLYIRSQTPAAHHQARALIFDLGAGMGAREASGTRLDEARRQALEIVAAAKPGDNFSVMGYALEATVRRAPTSHLADVRQAIGELKSAALPARAVAMRAALMRARGTAEIDLFADRAPASDLLNSAGAGTHVRVHQVGEPAANLAIVALEPGTLYLVNPGSVGQPRDGDPRAAYAIFDAEQNTVSLRRVRYPVQRTADEILKAGLPDVLALRLFQGM